ncbi:hypothetical protein DICVIV_14439 [Dictyocaulus viviparus]|uniref:Uncharacterized protein n=1 Tax=Dictyocaulus viviparus TaxID=29172 RepID=A0A0D8X7T5_DICVI|nr:hypothetical protein DICVIV_14439 [Dictyocaulus viviparus]
MLSFSDPITEKDLPAYDPDDELEETQQDACYRQSLDDLFNNLFNNDNLPDSDEQGCKAFQSIITKIS